MVEKISQTIDIIAREKGVESKRIVHALEDAMATACRRFFKDDVRLLAHLSKEK
jgi:hypothetical protein